MNKKCVFTNKRKQIPQLFTGVVILCLVGTLIIAGCTENTGIIDKPRHTTNSTAITFTDGLGNVVTLPAPAKRVICLNSDAAEMLIALSAADTVVGVTSATLKDPVLASHLSKAESVGTWDVPSIEKIIALKPDAIISYAGYRLKNAEQFERAGIQLIYFDCNRLSTLTHDAKSLGLLVGREKEAAKYMSFVEKWKKIIDEKTSPMSPVPVYIEGYTDYAAQGTNRSIGDMLVITHGKNIADGGINGYLTVTPEWIISKNPEVIIKEVSASRPDKITLDTARLSIISRPALADVAAVKQGKVYAISGDIVLGPRAPAGLLYMAGIIHPDSVKEINVSEALNEYARDFVAGTDSNEVVSPKI